LSENVYKRISTNSKTSANPNSNPNSNPNLSLKHKNLFGKTKWRQFSGKCPEP